MRYRYRFQDGRHLVCARDDAGKWNRKPMEYASAEAAREAAAVLDAGAATPGPAKAEAAPAPAPEPDMTTKEGVEAEKAKADAEGEPLDQHDLTAIPGIGAATAEKLNMAGIRTLKMLARVSQTRAEDLGIRADWIAEAKRLTE